MNSSKSNIILIGMPGSGKSTVGVILAKMLALDFLDTDILIQKLANRTLQEIVDTEGHMALRTLEQQALLSIDCSNHVIATGGSAAYSAPAMHHLQDHGIVVFLHADLAALRRRVRNYESRGIAKRPGQSFQDLFTERLELYKKYAEITIESSLLTHDQVCSSIIKQMQHVSPSRCLPTAGLKR